MSRPDKFEPAVGADRVAASIRPARLVLALVYRNVLVWRHGWLIIFSGFFEPVFYLYAMGFGLGSLVPSVRAEHGLLVSYPAFVAPAMFAASAMNGAVFDSTGNLFHKLREARIFETILNTPVTVGQVVVSELIWALARGFSYALAFLGVMFATGSVVSWWGLLMLPTALLIGLCFAGAGMALTTFLRHWADFNYLQVLLLPMFLFSATFFPSDQYPAQYRWLVQVSPLYHAVRICRALNLGQLDWSLGVDVGFLLGLGGLGFLIAGRRLGRYFSA